MSKKDFNEFRFEGLNFKKASNKYYTMDRVSEDEKKIVVKVSDEHMIQTRYGYALILNCKTVVFLKPWQVSENYFGVEVLLTKDFFIPKEWGFFDNFGDDTDNLKWETWIEVAKAQDNLKDEDGLQLNRVKWAK